MSASAGVDSKPPSSPIAQAKPKQLGAWSSFFGSNRLSFAMHRSHSFQLDPVSRDKVNVDNVIICGPPKFEEKVFDALVVGGFSGVVTIQTLTTGRKLPKKHPRR